ncbi:hypothetical protein EKH55_1853 [Sinorhizobium alkalisoli]|nr:hypothetical protein EKH55_1853 [Sinorhizobium alkalisoli]
MPFRARQRWYSTGGHQMSQEWPMYILQCIVVFGLVGALFIRFGE